MSPHPSIQPVGETKFTKMLLHGDIGIGKTSFIGTGGKDFKVLLLRPPLDHPDPIYGSGVQEWVVRDWTEMFECLDYLRHEGKDWDWVWLDSLSLWQDVGLDDIWHAAIDRKASRREYGPDKPEYGINMGRIGEWVRHVVGPDQFNLGITCHSIDMMDPTVDDGSMIRLPWIQGKGMISKICGYMNLVGYMEVRTAQIRGETKRQRILYTQKDEHHYAKDQYNAFGEKGTMVNPTLPKVVEAIEAARAAKRRRTTVRPLRQTARRG